MNLVYIITNKINGKQYVGITSQRLQSRWIGHISDTYSKNSQLILHKAIRKYGKDNFSIESIYESESYEHILRMETYFINLIGTHKSNGGYNITMGGEGVVGLIHTDETRAQMSKSHIGNTHSNETKRKISESLTGRTHSKEHIENMSEATRGRVVSKEWRDNLSKAQTGRKHSQETIEKMKNIRNKFEYTIYHPCGKVTKTKYLSDFCKSECIGTAYITAQCARNLKENITDPSKMYSARGYKMSRKLL